MANRRWAIDHNNTISFWGMVLVTGISSVFGKILVFLKVFFVAIKI